MNLKKLCTCSEHGMQLFYRDDMVGTQLVAGAYNKEHQTRLLSESASLLTLQDKWDRLCSVDNRLLETLGESPTVVAGQQAMNLILCVYFI